MKAARIAPCDVANRYIVQEATGGRTATVDENWFGGHYHRTDTSLEQKIKQGRTPPHSTNRPALFHASQDKMTRSGHLVLVLGGARSGKSAFAEGLVTATGLERHYVATGQAFDDEMVERIARHRADRGAGWTTHEVPVDLSAHLAQIDAPDRVVLVDCLTLWVTNLMMADMDVDAAADTLLRHLRACQSRVVLVSNEVGLGIVPENRMARAFRDHAGRLHQKIAAAADEVHFIAAGLPLRLKG